MTTPAHHETPDLAELRRLAEAATPGPWEAFGAVDGRRGERWLGVTTDMRAIESARAGDVFAAQNCTRQDALFIAAANPAVMLALLDAAAERDRLAEAVERVRALHGPRVVQVLGATCSAEECDHEDACPLVDYAVCGHCYDVGAGARPYAYEDGRLQDVAHPCATYRALDATPETGGES